MELDRHPMRASETIFESAALHGVKTPGQGWWVQSQADVEPGCRVLFIAFSFLAWKLALARRSMPITVGVELDRKAEEA